VIDALPNFITVTVNMHAFFQPSVINSECSLFYVPESPFTRGLEAAGAWVKYNRFPTGKVCLPPAVIEREADFYQIITERLYRDKVT
jgi:hypothetical protein